MDKKVLDEMITKWQNWRYPPEKPKLKSKKKKKILKESSPGYDNREFGDPLPTLADTAKDYAKKEAGDEDLNEFFEGRGPVKIKTVQDLKRFIAKMVVQPASAEVQLGGKSGFTVKETSGGTLVISK